MLFVFYSLITFIGQSGSQASSQSCWVRKGGEHSQGALLHPPPQGGGLEGWDASRPPSCLLQASQPADNGGLIPSGCPAVIKTELQHLAEFTLPTWGWSLLGVQRLKLVRNLLSPFLLHPDSYVPGSYHLLTVETEEGMVYPSARAPRSPFHKYLLRVWS